MSNSECKSECMTLTPVDTQSVVPSAAAQGTGASPLWLLTGLPVAGVGVALLSGGRGTEAVISSPSTPGPAVPLTDIALLPSAVLTIFVMVLLKKRMGSSV